MNGAEVRAMKTAEIAEELGRQRAKLFALRNKRVSEKIEDTTQFGKLRRDIARLLTEQTARAKA
jgi:large subunit ribosomal protein L29